MAWRESFQPLRVRAYLRSGVVSDRWLPLDGILFYQAMRERFGAQDATIPGGPAGDKVQHVSTPLEIHEPGTEHWYYKCSWAQWSHDVEGRDHWNKRFDTSLAHLVDFRGRRGKVKVEAGPMKAYHMPVFYHAALAVEWYCVGDKGRIEYLLSTVTHLGKKAAQGWGRVSRWEVGAQEEDWSVWHGERLMRGIPAAQAVIPGSQFNLANYGLRPSYWNRRNQFLLAMPHDRG